MIGIDLNLLRIFLRSQLEHCGSARCEQLGGFYRAEEEFNGNDAILSYLKRQRREP